MNARREDRKWSDVTSKDVIYRAINLDHQREEIQFPKG